MEIMIFEKTSSVLSYLQDCGWKIKKSAFYKHLKDVKLKPGLDGKYQSKDIDRYARIFLKRRDGNKRIGASTQKIISMQERRLRAETRKLESQAKHWELKARAAAGEFMDREQVEHELAMRTILFKSTLQNFILTQTPELVRICGGDYKKIDELQTYFAAAAADWMNEFSKKIEWNIIIVNDPDDPEMLIATVTPGADREDDSDIDNDINNDIDTNN